MGYSPWGSKELDRTEQLNTHIHSLDFFFKVVPQSMQNFSSPTRDRTCAPCLGTLESQSLEHQGSRSLDCFISVPGVGPKAFDFIDL